MVAAASFADSTTDSILSYLNYRMHRLAQEGADQEHPFGHGGFEVITSLLQGALVSASGLVVIVESAYRLVYPPQTFHPESIPYAIGVLVLAGIAGFLIYRYLWSRYKLIQDQNKRSLAYEADKAHYLSDFFVNISSAIGLWGVYLTKSSMIDSVFGLLGGAMILKTGVPILKTSISDILHTQIEPDEQRRYVEIILASDHRISGIHRLRSRRSGPITFIDFHLKLPTELPLHEAHDIGEVVRKNLRAEFPNLDVVIHLDPDNEPDDDLFEPAY